MLMSIILPYMVRSGEQQHVTEPYVSVPPALTITDEAGAIWTLGFRFGEAPRGEFAFNVLRNGVETGDIASRIERRQGRIRIFTAQGWKWMKSASPDGMMRVFGIGARMKGDQPPSPVAVTVEIYFDHRPEQPAVNGMFNSLSGWVKDLSALPLCCSPGRWLYATIRPVTLESSVEVMAYLGDQQMRAIPIVKQLVAVKE